MKQKGILLVIIACIFWGLMGITSRNLHLLSVDAFAISFFRVSIAGFCYLIWILKRNKSMLNTDLKSIVFFAVYGIVTFAIPFIAYNISIARIPISVATVLMFTSPIWVIFIKRVFFYEKISRKKMIVIMLVIFGCMLISKLYQIKHCYLDPIGIFAGLLNGLLFALQIVMPKFYKGKCKKDTMIIYGFLFAGLFLALFMDFKKISYVMINNENLTFLIENILAIGVLSTFVANTAYIKSTEYIDESLTSILSSLELVISSIFAYFIFHETLEPLQILGMLIVICAVTLLEVDIQHIFKKIHVAKHVSH